MNKYKEIKKDLKNIDLCIVTKNRSKEEIMHYYNLNERIFGENRAQELLTKVDLPNDIKWHFIGRLQTNKVRSILPYVDCIQSVDSLRLAKFINKEAKRIDKVVNVLIQFNLSQEETKTGLSYEDAFDFFKQCEELTNINIKGIMLMGPNVDDKEEIKKVFKQGRELFDSLKLKYSNLDTLSMGMSDDYKLAIEENTTMVRIGSILFN